MKTCTMILIAAAFFMSGTVGAQSKATTFGVKIGLNVSDIRSLEDKEFNNTSSKTGFLAGIMVDHAFTPEWHLLTGLEYSTKGVKIDAGTDWDITAAYVQLPLCAGYKISPNDKFSILFNLGPYFAYGVGGKTTGGTSKYDTFSDLWMKNFDCGINFGASLEIQKFCVGLGGDIGLVNIMQSGNSKAATSNMTLWVGYKF